MKKTLAAVAAFLALCSTAVAGPPPRPYNSQRVHVSPSHRMHTPTGNRVRMTPVHGQTGPVGGRMSSMPNSYHHERLSSGHVHVHPSHASVYARPSMPPHRYYRSAPPPHWRYGGYYSGHYWRSYNYGTVWFGAPMGWYGYPWYGYYRGRHGHPRLHVGFWI